MNPITTATTATLARGLARLCSVSISDVSNDARLLQKSTWGGCLARGGLAIFYL